MNTQEMISSTGKQAAWEPGKTKTMTMTNLQNTMKDMRAKFGFVDDANGAYTIPNDKARDVLANRLNMPRDEVDGFVRDINRFSQQVINEKGQMKPEQVIKMQRVFGKMADEYAPAFGEKASSTFANAVQFKNAFRDDFMAGASQFLSPESKAAFETAKDRFHQLMTLPKGVDRLLAKDSPATADIAAWLDKGAEANSSNIMGLQNL